MEESKGDTVDQVEGEIIEWFSKRPLWQQEAVRIGWQRGALNDDEVQDLAKLLSQEGEKQENRVGNPLLFHHGQSMGNFRLLSVGEIVGIDYLRPKTPLSFSSDSNLSVVFGSNGAGKSGYVRILKKAAGKPGAGELRHNIFEEAPGEQSCVFEVELDGKKELVQWDCASGCCNLLVLTDIFDSALDRFYLDGETEVSYVPPLLGLFSFLVSVCKSLREVFEDRKQALPTKLPILPDSFSATEIGARYAALSDPDGQEIDQDLLNEWREKDEGELQELLQRLSTPDPAKEAKKKDREKQAVTRLLEKIDDAIRRFAIAECGELLRAKNQAETCREAALAHAATIESDAVFQGIGEKAWRAMWEAARNYSEQLAYPEESFPRTEDDAKCVLCHQALDSSARARLVKFDEFVSGQLERQATSAEHSYQKLIEQLPSALNDEEIGVACDSAGLEGDHWKEKLRCFWRRCSALKQSVLAGDLTEGKGIRTEEFPWIDDLRERVKTLSRQAEEYVNDSVAIDRAELEKKKLQLEARKWIANQRAALDAEVLRRETLQKLNRAIKATEHRDITRQAGLFSERLLTEAYVQRFNSELSDLGAGRIRVELQKSRAERGRALHQIILSGKDKRYRATEILSDGEKRVVALAAFLADVQGRRVRSTFVFDDPITSLDQEFEEKVVERLVRLSAERQVIVFTHRLSLASLISDKYKHTDLICIEREHWGAGNPDPDSLKGERPKGILSKLRDQELARARKALIYERRSAYRVLALSICSTFRKTVERTIELILLNDIVQRARRGIKTMNKLHRLTKITSEDCNLLDRLMTKYSVYVHSQSSELPDEPPEADELERDIQSLIDWISEFEKR